MSNNTWNLEGMDTSGETIPICLRGEKPELQAEHDRMHNELKANRQFERCFYVYGRPAAAAMPILEKLCKLEREGAFIRGFHSPLKAVA